jgi:arylsulfatase A-like enzyme
LFDSVPTSILKSDMKHWFLIFSCALFFHGIVSAQKTVQTSHPRKRNLIIFVADGLRNGSVNQDDAPTLLEVRRRGVYFANSHSLFPTFTTANASAIATGHFLGDTGDFSNVVYTQFQLFQNGNFSKPPGTVTPFLEDDQRLSDLDDHFYGNYLNEATLLATARKNGYATATVGKLGPTAIQDIEALRPSQSSFAAPQGIILDDSTGRADGSGQPMGVPLRKEIQVALASANLDLVAPDRSNGCRKTDQCNNGFSGDPTNPGTSSANTRQQHYFADAVTKAILPVFANKKQPFVLLFWSRDPDGTQHNQGDSLNKLTPGINGATSRAAVKNADDNLKQILEYINASPGLRSTTDVIITSDHGFATISRSEIDAAGKRTNSYSARFKYHLPQKTDLEIPEGTLPNGFLAIDLGHSLGLKIFDPDRPSSNPHSRSPYEEVDPTSEPTSSIPQHPLSGNALLGESVERKDGSDAKVIVAANGGSDLIYIPDNDPSRVRAVVDVLTRQDYVGGIFVNTDLYGDIPGALALRSVELVGSALLPPPAVIVTFRVFYTESGNLQSAVQISDTVLQTGQGMHGGLGRDSTFNNMAAIGPDFKVMMVDRTPVSNADIAVTAATILGFDLPSKGCLRGRVLREALKRGPASVPSTREIIASKPSNGHITVLHFQRSGSERYLDRACFLSEQAETRLSCPF